MRHSSPTPNGFTRPPTPLTARTGPNAGGTGSPSDFQVFRNRAAYPRAWVVHDARSLPALAGSGRAGRDAAIRAILSDSSDPHRTAWLDADQRVALTAYLPGTPPPSLRDAGDHCLQATRGRARRRPGAALPADPGRHLCSWLALDDRRGPSPHPPRQPHDARAAVAAGRHHLVFRYEPRAFGIGMALSVRAWRCFAVLAGAFWFQPENVIERTGLSRNC